MASSSSALPVTVRNTCSRSGWIDSIATMSSVAITQVDPPARPRRARRRCATGRTQRSHVESGERSVVVQRHAGSHLDVEPDLPIGGHQLALGASTQDAALVDDDDLRSERLDLGQVVRRVHDPGAVVGQRPNRFDQVVPGPDIGADGGLVQEEQRGSVHQRAGGVEATGLTARQLRAPPVHQVGQAEVVGDELGPLLPLLAAQAGDLAEELQVLPDGQHPVDARVLRGDADALRAGSAIREYVDAVDRDRPGVGIEQPGDDREQGGLARSVAPQERHDLSGLDRQVHAARGPARRRSSWPPPRRAAFRHCGGRPRPAQAGLAPSGSGTQRVHLPAPLGRVSAVVDDVEQDVGLDGTATERADRLAGEPRPSAGEEQRPGQFGVADQDVGREAGRALRVRFRGRCRWPGTSHWRPGARR